MPLSPPFAAPPLVGREREQEIVRAALDAAIAGQGRFVLLAGEAGIGKTALAEALGREAAARGAAVCAGACYDRTETPPYGLWGDLFARYQFIARDASAALPPPPPTFAAPGVLGAIANQAVLVHQVREWVRTVVNVPSHGIRPLVLLLDDLHWSDPASLDVLRVIARDGTALPLLIVATYRSDEVTRDHPLFSLLPLLAREAAATRVALHPLGADALRTYVERRYALGAGDAAALTGYLAGRSEGNPFFMHALLHDLEEEGALHRETGGWRLGALPRTGVPILLRQVIEARFARFGREAYHLLAVAAIVGQAVPLPLWQAVSGADDETLLDLIEQGVGAHLLREAADGTGVTFAHALIREALYEAMPVTRRRLWHTRIAEALIAARDPDPDAVAYHLSVANDPRTATWLVRAGERADAAHAYRTADARFTDALDRLTAADSDLTLRCTLLIRLGRLRRQRDPAQSVRFVEEAARLAQQTGDAALVGVSLYRIGASRAYAGERRRGIALMAEGLHALDALPHTDVAARFRAIDPITASVAARHSVFALRVAEVGRFAEAERHAARGLAVFDGALVHETVNGSEALGNIARQMGRPREARERAAGEWAHHRTTEEHDSARWIIANELYWAALVYATDDRDYLARLRAELDARPPEPGEVFATLPLRAMHLPALFIEGHWAETRALARHVAACRFATHPFAQNVPLVHGRLLLAQGAYDAAWALVHAELPDGPRTEPGNNRYPTSVALQRLAAELALAAGDLPAARAWLAAHDRWLTWSGAVHGWAEGNLLRARLREAAGDPSGAEALAALALAGASDARQPLVLLATHRFRGERATAAGRHAEAATDLDAALALADACAAPYERALTLLAMAERCVATGAHERAHELLGDVRAIAGPLGARPALARADALLARVVAAAAGPPRYPDGLTAREVVVLRALAAGRSNREIATALDVNPRTVERHISNLYTKIGAVRRAEATAYAFRHGLTEGDCGTTGISQV